MSSSEPPRDESHGTTLDSAVGSPEAPAMSERTANFLLALFVVYVVLLGIGVVAEAFDIQWILNWPIY